MDRAAAFRRLSFDDKLNELHRLVLLLIEGDAIIMTTQTDLQADINAKAASLNARLTIETNAEKALITYAKDIVQQLADARAQLAAAHPTLDLSSLDAIGAGIDANASAAAAALVANTPASSSTTPSAPAAPTTPMTPAGPDAGASASTAPTAPTAPTTPASTPASTPAPDTTPAAPTASSPSTPAAPDAGPAPANGGRVTGPAAPDAHFAPKS